ncbi:attachment subunit-related family [Trichomonas vaginalis G3]|uniref:attachment subunit-related family n=1 Tax=Trichomonas vaginalis (strain ATCC PRA-98 / G3) TaxID=412133 RepID=UPI0021E5C88C|nr:attachment subunit-related family [Trichomonas vaginalis G3]KAI5530070.1 attachment subunit-related family [Trichomonas vaginalis G3]
MSNNLSSSSSQNTTETSETDLQPAPEQVSHSSTSMLTRAQFQDLISLEQYSSNETQSDDCNLSLPESIQRKYAMKRLKLLYKLLNNWGVEDNSDYSEMFNKVIESVKPIENDIKNPGVLVDLFASKLPVTTNLIATQAIEQFILCFPKQYRQHLRETRIGKFQLVYPTTYNYYEEANEYGELSFHFTLSVPEEKKKQSIMYNLLQDVKENLTS